MTTVQKTSNKLTVKFFPWFIWVMTGFSIVVILPILLSMLLQPISKSLTCKRIEAQKINCQFQNSTSPFSSSQTVVVKDLQGAKFKKNAFGYFLTQKQELILLTKNGEVSFLFHRSYHPQYTASRMSQTAFKINAFVKNPNQQSLNLQKENIASQWILFAAFVNGIIMTILMGEIGICEFDRTSGYMTKKRRWLFVFTKTTKYPLFDIKDVQVEWTRHKSIVYRTAIILTSGKKIPLSTYHANYLKSKRNITSTADNIRNFLSLTKKKRLLKVIN